MENTNPVYFVHPEPSPDGIMPPFVHADGSLWFLRHCDIDPYLKPLEDDAKNRAFVANEPRNAKAYSELEILKSRRRSANINFESAVIKELYYETALNKAESPNERQWFKSVYMIHLVEQKMNIEKRIFRLFNA